MHGVGGGGGEEESGTEGGEDGRGEEGGETVLLLTPVECRVMTGK